jgi:hypothetical protein
MSAVTVQPLDTSANLLAALLWQHNNATRLTCLMQAKQAWINTNQADFWTNWVRDVFDLRTANAFGLQVWGIILGIPISIGTNSAPVIRPAFGFSTENENFDNANFLPGQGNGENLTLDEARFLLQLRYFCLICRPCTVQVNQFLARVFPGVACFDTFDMSGIDYVFQTPPSPALATLLQRYDVLPRAATVGTGSSVLGRPRFGFGEYNENFNNGTF